MPASPRAGAFRRASARPGAAGPGRGAPNPKAGAPPARSRSLLPGAPSRPGDRPIRAAPHALHPPPRTTPGYPVSFPPHPNTCGTRLPRMGGTFAPGGYAPYGESNLGPPNG
ncbi:hypothetical protein GCM10017688_23200 [Streptomyces ramulosus]